MRSKLLLTAAMAALLAGCSAAKDESGPGGLVMTAAPLASPYQITQVEITATGTPGTYSSTLTFDPADGQWHGSMILPVGAYDVYAYAYGDLNGDGLIDLLGSGMASVIIYESTTSAAIIRILDVTGPPPIPDHSPILTSMTASNVFAVINEPLTLTGSAVDIDGDAISYLWSETCSSGVPSVFSDPTSPTTVWTPAAVGICTLRLDVTANGKTDSAWFDMPVYSGPGVEGTLQVAAYFVAHPFVNDVYVYGYDTSGMYFSQDLMRFGGEASVAWDLPAGGYMDMWVYADGGVDWINVLDNCGGYFNYWGFYGNYAQGTWYAPYTPAVCTITADLTRDGLYDAFPIAVNVR